MTTDGENLQELCPMSEGVGAQVAGKLTSEGKAVTESHLVKCSPFRRIAKLLLKAEATRLTPLYLVSAVDITSYSRRAQSPSLNENILEHGASSPA